MSARKLANRTSKKGVAIGMAYMQPRDGRVMMAIIGDAVT